MSLPKITGPVFRPLADTKGRNDFISHYTKIMAFNEGGNGTAAYILSNAGTNLSSWSFGLHQYDLLANQNGEKLMRNILEHATDGSGGLIVAPDEIDSLIKKMKTKGDISSVSAAERALVNTALQSKFGMDAIDSDFQEYATATEAKVNKVIESVTDVAVHDYLTTHLEAQLFISDVMNQFGVKVNKCLVEFLKGSEVQLPYGGGTVSISPPFDFDDLSAFAAATAYANAPSGAADLIRRQHNILDEVAGKLKLGSEGGKIKAKTALLHAKQSPLKASPLASALENEIAMEIRKNVIAAVGELRFKDPLVLDLDGSGTLDSLEERGQVYFDFDGNGFRESVGWVSPKDGLVVRDLNNDGIINNGSELFGDETIMPSGERAMDGFQALSTMDSNNDSIVDSRDAGWADLRVWRDSNSDGVTDSGELLTMEQAGISALNLISAQHGVRDEQGNTVAKLGSFVRQDGSTGLAGSFIFQRDTVNSDLTTNTKESYEVALLPELGGFGSVHSLHQAMGTNTELRDAVKAFSANHDFRTLRADFEHILFSWTGAQDAQPGSRGSFIDARKLAVVEAFFGDGFVGTEGPNPIYAAAVKLNSAYDSIFNGFFSELLMQTSLSGIWDNVFIGVNEATGEPTADYTEAIGPLKALLSSDSATAAYLLYEFVQSVSYLAESCDTNLGQLESYFKGSEFGYDRLIKMVSENRVVSFGTTSGDNLALAGSGIIFGLGGQDQFNGSRSDDFLVGSLDADKMQGDAGSDTLHGGAGADYLDGGAGDDYLFGGDGNDRLDDSEGANVFVGGAGDDILGTTLTTAFWGPNVYIGGTGNDTAIGSRGADTYVFNKGDGQDVIRENQYNGGGDVLKFGDDVLAADWIASRAGVDLVLSDAQGLDKITIAQWFDSADKKAYRIDHAEFADGTIWSAAEMTERAQTVYGTAAADVLRGLDGVEDVIHGLAGDDVILGFGGNDKLYGDDGSDTVYGGAGNDVLQGGAGNDNLDGEAGDDYLSGGAGDDRLYDDQGSNTFDGGDGNDRLMSANTTAFWGPNTYNGGKGDDIIFGSRGGDTYLFNVGDGQDLIIENPYGSGTDVVQFGAGVQLSDFSAARRGDNLVLTGANGVDKLTFQDWFWAQSGFDSQIELFKFADGNVLTGAEVAALVGAPNLAAHYSAAMFTI